jgi:hypothetical protein
MAMTREAQAAKVYILRLLAQQGYKKYAEIFQHFDLELTRRKDVVGYMIADEMTIVLNADLEEGDYVSTVVRHEILHQYLDHMNRLIKHVGLDVYENRNSTLHEIFNRAADYEISNVGYTTRDKEVTRKLRVGSLELRGLLTEDDHPDWVNLTMEEIYDKLIEEKNKLQSEKPEPEFQQVRHTPEYIEGYSQAIRDYKSGKIKYDPEKKCLIDSNGNPIQLD